MDIFTIFASEKRTKGETYEQRFTIQQTLFGVDPRSLYGHGNNLGHL